MSIADDILKNIDNIFDEKAEGCSNPLDLCWVGF